MHPLLRDERLEAASRLIFLRVLLPLPPPVPILSLRSLVTEREWLIDDVVVRV